MASEYELWADYLYGTESVMVCIDTDPGNLVELAETLVTRGHATHWYIIEKRMAVSFHVHRMMGE